MNNLQRIKNVAAAVGLSAMAFGAIYSLIWMIWTKAAWIPIVALVILIIGAVPTAVGLYKYLKG